MRVSRILIPATALVLAATLLAGCAARLDDWAAKNKVLVREALDKVLVEGQASAIDTYFGPFVQHDPAMRDGTFGLEEFLAARQGKPPLKLTVHRIFADHSLVVVHATYENLGPKPLVVFDVFRIARDRIVEHWENGAPLEAPNASGRTMIDGVTEISDWNRTERNKALVRSFVEKILMGREPAALRSFFEGDKYVQHDPKLGDGVVALQTALKERSGPGGVTYSRLHKVIGEGNFVLAMSEGTIGTRPVAFYDLFRLENGKLAEHWDVVAPIPPPVEHQNPNGKF